MNPYAWEIIKNKFTENKTPGSVGYFRRIYEASSLFISLLSSFKDIELQRNIFKKDEDVARSIMIYKQTEDIFSKLS